MLLLIEFGLVLLALALAFVCPGLGSRWFEILERRLATLARKQKLAVLVVAFAALAARATVLPILPVPQPRLDDEFSYLLAADTFAHGRLANRTPAMWRHFETFHVIMRPSYASKFPPAQGFSLALGQIIAGSPFVGVWLSVGLMCGAICWMLQGWLSPEWALVGGALAVIRFAIFSYWANSYLGGAVAATGGALLLGAFPRILRSQRVRDSLLMGLGLAILANSRPYEGLALSLPVAFALLVWLSREKGPQLVSAARRVALPLTLVLAMIGAGTAYYSWRVTGDPLRMPYQVYEATYDPAPLFLWQPLKPLPVYRHAAMSEFYRYEALAVPRMRTSLEGFLEISFEKAWGLWVFFLGPVLVLPLLMAIPIAPKGLRWARLDPQTRFLLVAGAISMIALAVEFYANAHYAAPMTCLIFALVLYAMRSLRHWTWRRRHSGLFLSRAVPGICLLMLALRAGASPLHIPLGHLRSPTWYNLIPAETDRAAIHSQLERLAGNQLVIVRYEPHSSVPRSAPWPHEWVYNRADIDSAKVIWAWDMGPAENRELIDHYPGRRVWWIDTAKDQPSFVPYPAPQGLAP